MSVEALGGGASVGSGDRNGGNNVGDEWIVGMDQIEEFSEGEMKQFDCFEESLKAVDKTCPYVGDEWIVGMAQIEEFSEGEMKQFDCFEEALIKAVDKTCLYADAKPKIQKVPYNLRNNDKFHEYFEPKMFSFGPYFDDPDCSTLKEAKQIKVNLVFKFLQQNGVRKEYLYREIKNQIKELKDCYDDDLTKDYKDKDHELAWMFMVDGCAILQFMYIFVDLEAEPETQFRKLGIKTDYVEFLAHDLFLLENQLPYQLLQLIIRQTSKKAEIMKSIYKLIFQYFRKPEEWNKNKMEILKDLEDNHVHLLDLLRKKLIQPLHQTAEKLDLIEIINSRTADLFNKLKCNRNEFDRDRFPIPHRNIGKLREAGINLEPSKTSCVIDFSFSGGTLKLPPIILGESTTTMLLNMLAYEMCPGFHNGFEVSTYMFIMNKLIDRTKDVEELREKNILQNELGSDKKVVKLFNGISTHLRPNKEYYEMKRRIDNYFDNKWLVYYHQYFNRRWSLLAFIAVFSTVIQTLITVLAYQADLKKGN